MLDVRRPRHARLTTSAHAVLGVVGGLAVAVLLAVMVLLLGGFSLPVAGTRPATPSVLAGLVPWLGLGLATAVGSVLGIGVAAVAVRDLCARRQATASAAWGRSSTSLPRVLALVVLGPLLVALAGLAAPTVSLVCLARSLWLLRAERTRASGVRSLWLVVPGALAVAMLVALPVAWASLLAGTGLREALARAGRQSWRGRAAVLGGLLVVVAAVVGTTWLSLRWVDDAGTWGGASVLATAQLAQMLLVGAALGWLGHRRGEPPTDGLGLARASLPSARRTGRWTQGRLASVSVVALVSLLAPLAPGVLLATAQAAEVALAANTLAPEGPFVVDTLDDRATPSPGECLDAGAPCGLRAALDLAAATVVDGGTARVELAVDGTIHLADTLRVPSGVVVDATGSSVTLDADHATRALEAFTAQESEGGSITLRGFTVTGGRSAEGGAGLFSDNVMVRLDQMTFTDNVSGTSPASQTNGGAVAVPYTHLWVSASTFEDNRALQGAGGAVVASTVVWTNSTSVHDTGADGEARGGSVLSLSGGTVTHGTFVDGGGVSGGDNGSPLTVVNSFLDTASANFPCSRTTSATDEWSPSVGNIEPTGTCLDGATPVGPYGDLADNGGPTRTVALFPGSAALGAGDPSVCEAVDQRGETRDPASCDAGAFQATSGDVPAIDIVLEPMLEARVGMSVDLGARLTSAAALPAGSVRFLDGTDVVARDVPVRDGVARTQVPRLPQGARSLTAEFVPADGDPVQASEPVVLLVRSDVRTSFTTTTPVRLHDPVTVTVTVDAPDDEPGVPAPTGRVHFRTGSVTHDATLVDGVATWTIDSLVRADLEITYEGDDAHLAGASGGTITTEDLATVTTYVVDRGRVRFGDDVAVTADVSDGTAPATGRVQLVVDGSVVTSAQVDGSVGLTATLPPGAHRAHLVYVPLDGWSASESAAFDLVVDPAEASVELDPFADRDFSATTRLTATGRVTGAGRDGAVVRLLDGDREVATAGAGSDGSVTWQFWSSLLPAGTHDLVAEVVGSDRVDSVRSGTRRVTIAKAAPLFQVSRPAPGRVGATVDIPVGSGQGPLVGDLELRRVGDDEVIARGRIDGTSSSIGFVPTTWGWSSVEVTFLPDQSDDLMRSYLPATRTIGFDVDAAYLPRPTAAWTTPVTPDASLVVSFGDLHPAPAGRIELVDANRGVIAQSPVVDGQATLVPGGELAGVCLCGTLTLRYAGDAAYHPLTTYAPDVAIPTWSTTTRMDALPATVGRGDALHLSARVDSPYRIPTGSVVFTVGEVDLDPVTLVDGRATTSYTSPVSRTLDISARYVPGHHIWSNSAAAAQTVVVSPVPEPVLELTSSSTGLRVGATATVQVRVVSGGSWITPGTQIAVVDSQGAGIGSTFAAGAALPGAVLPVTVTPRHVGDQQLRAVFVFDGGRQGSSAPLAMRTTMGAPLVVDPLADWSMVGRSVPVAVSLDRFALNDAAAEPGPVRVQLRSYQDPVGDPIVLDEANGFTVVVQVPTDVRGDLQLNALTTEGDGRFLTAAQSDPVPVDVRGLDVPVAFSGPGEVVRGDVWVPTFALERRYPESPLPTGAVTVRLVRSGSDEVVSGCRVTLPATTCDVSTTGLSVGRYDIELAYDGDRLYQPFVHGRGSMQVRDDRASLTVGFDRDSSDWLVGQQVRATWRSEDPRSGVLDGTSPGTVRLFLAGNGLVCEAPAQAGGCTFTVPDHRITWQQGQPTIMLDYVYVPATSSAPVSGSLRLTTPRHCLPVVVENAYAWGGATRVTEPTVSGTACSVGDVHGFVDGTQVTVTASSDTPTNGVFRGWRISGGIPTSVTDGRTATFVVTGNARAEASYAWAPRCVTLTLTDEEGHAQTSAPFRDPGRLDIATPSNCGSPGGETLAERQDRYRGIGHFVSGTDVTLETIQYYAQGTVADPTYTLLDVPGTLPADGLTQSAGGTLPKRHVVVSADTSLFPRWRVSPVMCTRVRTYAGSGGTLAVTRSTPPPKMLRAPADGSCTTPSGDAGLLAGTAVELTATPTAPSYAVTPELGEPRVERWFGPRDFDETDSRGRDRATNPVTLDLLAIGTTDRTAGAQTRAETIPLTRGDATGARYGVRFSRVNCVPVTLTTRRYLTSYQLQAPSPLAAATRTESNCPAVSATEPVTATTWVDPRYQYARTVEGTVWYVRGTEVSTSTPALLEPARRGDDYGIPRWEMGDNAALEHAVEPPSRQVEDPHDWSVLDPPRSSQVTLVAGRSLWLRSTYVPATCGRPDVTVSPARYGYSWDPKVSSGACADDQVYPGSAITLKAQPSVDRLQPVWSISGPGSYSVYRGRSDAKGSTVIGQSFTFAETHRALNARIRLTYCAPLDVAVEPVGPDGTPLSADGLATLDAAGWGEWATPYALLDDGGGCPAALMGTEGSAQRVGLRGDVRERWIRTGATLNGQQVPEGENPIVRVGAGGATSDRARIQVTARCFELQPGDRVEVDTPANCPGSAGWWYLSGTSVTLHFRGAKDKEFESWANVDASDGEVAVVIMNATRNPTVDWDNLSVWEQIGNVFSSITQRLVSALTVVAMAVVGKVVVVGTVASLLLDVVAMGLDAVGADGAADILHKTSDIVEAGVGVVTGVSQCMSQWATGGASPVVPTYVNQANSGVGGAGTVLRWSGDIPSGSTLGTASRQVGNVLNAVNAFASGPEAYLSDAREAWGSITSVGSCMEAKVDKVAAGG